MDYLLEKESNIFSVEKINMKLILLMIKKKEMEKWFKKFKRNLLLFK